MRNTVSVIKENVRIVETSIIGGILLGLEKLMDLQFKCPETSGLAIGYSLVFLIIPTIIVGIVVCSYNPQKENSTEIKGGTEVDSKINVTSNVPSKNVQTSETKPKAKKCKYCCKFLKKHWLKMKVVGSWILIVITDGRYLACLLKTIYEPNPPINSNISDTELQTGRKDDFMDYIRYWSQIIGLVAFLVAVIVATFCEWCICRILSCCGCEPEPEPEPESESERCRKTNEVNLLQITEDILQKEAKERQKAFVVNLLSREDWATYNPGSPNALEKLGEITAKWKEEIKTQLNHADAGLG